MSAGPEIVPLFSTPIVISDVPDAAALNAELRRVIEQRRKSHPGTQHSNLGGWQSTWDMDRWGGAPAIKLLAIARNTASRDDGSRGKPVSIAWRANMWPTSTRADMATSSSHPGSFWSGVYYVDDGGIAADPSLGGELEFMDPRGPGPAMYAPQLAFAMPGGLSVGANETVHPKAGRLVMFPAWLLHQVRPYRGGGERISIDRGAERWAIGGGGAQGAPACLVARSLSRRRSPPPGGPAQHGRRRRTRALRNCDAVLLVCRAKWRRA
jgi:uncharacterized protein (TIGR02466 family)